MTTLPLLPMMTNAATMPAARVGSPITGLAAPQHLGIVDNLYGGIPYYPCTFLKLPPL